MPKDLIHNRDYKVEKDKQIQDLDKHNKHKNSKKVQSKPKAVVNDENVNSKLPLFFMFLLQLIY